MKLKYFSLLALLGPPCAAAAPFEVMSGDVPTHLVELFSSEGCSSCPPADAWVASLRGDARLWKEFVPVAFHVDYWNRLGWQDRFSRDLFTRRQNDYASAWGASHVYTPGFVLDGNEWKAGWLGGRSIPERGAGKAGVLAARATGPRRFAVSFRPAADGDWTVHAALLGNGLTSRVTSGENSGKTLRHEFVVLRLVRESLKKSDSGYAASLDLASTSETPAASYSLAVWVTRAGDTRPVQAVGGDLP